MSKESAVDALIALFRENGIPMSDRNGRLHDTILAALEGGEEPVAPDAVWLIYYDDFDRRPEIVVGEAGARARFARISDSWNAHLFVKVKSNSRDDRYHDANIRLASPIAADTLRDAE